MTQNEQEKARTPRRDVEGDNECAYCGGGAQGTLGDEHVWKCSEIVPKEQLRQLLKQWREDRDEYDSSQGGTFAAMATEACAKELEYLLEQGELIEDE